jgi:hypothetical protein
MGGLVNTKSRSTLPFLIIQNDFVVYASQVFCRLHNIDNHIFESSKIPVSEVFEKDDLSICRSSQNQDSLKQQLKKRIKLKSGQIVYVAAREIKWNNSNAFQLFFSE